MRQLAATSRPHTGQFETSDSATNFEWLLRIAYTIITKSPIEINTLSNEPTNAVIKLLTISRSGIAMTIEMTNRTINRGDQYVEGPDLDDGEEYGLCWAIYSTRRRFVLDNVRDHRAGTEIMQAEKSTRKSGFACITLLSTVFCSELFNGFIVLFLSPFDQFEHGFGQFCNLPEYRRFKQAIS